MNKILIIDASTDRRVMSSLLLKAGYDPVVTECIDSEKNEVVKLSPGAVIVTAMRLSDGTAKDFVNWLKTEGYKFPVIAVVDNLNPMELIDVMCDWRAGNVIQRPAIDKQRVEMVARYASSEKHHVYPRQYAPTTKERGLPRYQAIYSEDWSYQRQCDHLRRNWYGKEASGTGNL